MQQNKREQDYVHEDGVILDYKWYTCFTMNQIKSNFMQLCYLLHKKLFHHKCGVFL